MWGAILTTLFLFSLEYCFFRPRLNIPVFLPNLGWKYSCNILNYSVWQWSMTPGLQSSVYIRRLLKHIDLLSLHRGLWCRVFVWPASEILFSFVQVESLGTRLSVWFLFFAALNLTSSLQHESVLNLIQWLVNEINFNFACVSLT